MSKLIVANLKMNKNSLEMSEYLQKISSKKYSNEVVILPSLSNLFLSTVYNQNIKYGVQNFYYKEEGSFTGEVNLTMLKDMNIKYALVGHSERRKLFNENNSLINKKILSALQNNITPILCIGESSSQLKTNLYKAQIKKQIDFALKGVKGEDLSKIVIAYEPTYAIGAEDGADLAKVENNISLIREIINSKNIGAETHIKVIYGGSVNLDNYKQYLDSEYIDGLLIGRASLDAENLIKIGR